MPIEVKTSAKYASLGDLSTFNVSTSAMPVDTSDTAGSVPTVSTTFADGKDVEYLIGEDFSLSAPSLGTYDGEVVSVGKSGGSNRHSLEVHNIITRLNAEKRLYPLSDSWTASSQWIPVNTLEYWTQQCGIFYSKVPGDVLFFQSQHGHYGAFAKDITRPLRAYIYRYSGTENFTSAIHRGRVMNTAPRDCEAILTFPDKQHLSDMGSTLPLMVPSDTRSLVFGGVVGLFGTGRQLIQKWSMLDAAKKWKFLAVVVDGTSGIRLQTAESETGVYTTRATVPITNGYYQYYVGVRTVGASTRFELRVLNEDGTTRGSSNVTVASGISGSMTLNAVSMKGSNTGSGSAAVYSDTFISLMDALPTGWLPYQKANSYGPKTSNYMVGFSGNVWEHIKQFCSIYHLEMNYRDGKLTVEPRQRDINVGASLSELSTSIQHREPARNVEVVNQQHEPTGGYPFKTMWSADTVYQVAVGEVQEFVVQTDHSIEMLSNPVCVSGITPLPYKEGAGQYVVTGSDGYIVSPAFWNDQGGSVTCDITEKEGEIKIRIKGPDFDSSRAPYRISEGDAGRPALHITGVGVKAKPKTLKVPTGNSKASKDVGVTIDSPFIGNAQLAYDAASRAAANYGGPSTTVTFAEPLGYDEESKLGSVPSGSLVKSDGNILRVTDANQTHSMVSGNAAQHNTIYQINRSFGEATIGEMNDYYDGKPIGKINLKPLKVVK